MPPPGGVRTLLRSPYRGNALGIGQVAIYLYSDGHAGELGSDADLEPSSEAVSLFLEYG